MSSQPQPDTPQPLQPNSAHRGDQSQPFARPFSHDASQPFARPLDDGPGSAVYPSTLQSGKKSRVPLILITLAVLSSPNSLDPRVGSDETSQRVHQLVFDNLLALDEQLRVTGGLAEAGIPRLAVFTPLRSRPRRS